ncbi:MAG TPA: VWA domain-containing protein [Vicinamibacterales bacterium]|nr:VWA domain-containing protein [Vicinamibacterales bacterium]
MRRVTIALCSICLAGAMVSGQQPQSPPVFRGGVDLVTLDVTVVDRDGTPVKGLTSGDFVVMLNGERRAVRALDYLEFGGLSDLASASSPQVSNQAAPTAQRRGGRVVLLVVDDLSAKPAQMTGLRASAQHMLAALDLGDLVGLATTSGLGPAIPPTRDRAAIKTALESREVVGRYDETTAPFYISVPEAIEINQVGGQVFAHEATDLANNATTFARVVNRECALFLAPGERVDDTCSAKVQRAAVHLAESIVHRASAQLAAYTHLIDALRPAPQPRVIIALSAGVATGADRSDYSELDPVARAAAKAGVQFYALTEMPDMIDMTDLNNERATARRAEGEYLTSGVQTVAETAGGEAFRVVGQADRFFSRVIAETSGMYQLGVEMPTVAPTSEFLNAKVSVTRPGVTVRTNTHALMPSAASGPVSIEDALQARVAQGGTAFGVAMTCATARRRAETGPAIQLGVTLRVPASTPPPLVMRFALVSGTGAIAQAGRQEIAQTAAGDDYWLTFAVPVDPGPYRLRVAVADRDGRVGAVEESVAAELPQAGPFLVSDLLTTWTVADGPAHFLALDTLPKTATNLRVSLELYPQAAAAGRDPVSVRLTIIPDGETDPIMAHDLVPSSQNGRLSVTGDVPVTSLPAGAYTIRATVLAAGAPVGWVSKTLRKSD